MYPTRIKRLRNRMKNALSKRPTLIFITYYIFVPKYRERLVKRNTEIVIAGYPRSANTFAYFAFRIAQGRDVNIAHHLHLPAQIIRGVQLRKPVLVLIRNPEQAVRSLCIRHPDASQSRALNLWMSFYNTVYQYCDKVVIVDFDEVTSDFGQTIEKLNAKYGTHFIPFQHTPDNVEIVYKTIEEFNKRFNEENELQVNRPSKVRQEIYRNFVWDGDAMPLLQEAQNLYQRILKVC